MFCDKCGNPVNPKSSFCGYCGSNLNHLKNKNSVSSEKEVKKENNVFYVISIIIGIATLGLSFVLNVLILPISTIGIVFGVIVFQQNRRKKLGLILNIISAFCSLAIFTFWVVSANLLAYYNPKYLFVGTWNCKSVSGMSESSDYVVTMKLDAANNFLWENYDDPQNNYVKGKFAVEKVIPKDYTINETYALSLTGKKFVVNGYEQTQGYAADYSVLINDEDMKSIFLLNLITANSYNCYLVDDSE